MAIRPVDLQLAYLSAPQNAAQIAAAQDGPAAAAAAAQASFAAQLHEREEQVERTDAIHNPVIRERRQRSHEDGRRGRDRRNQGSEPDDDDGEGPHFIDVTA